MEFKLSGQWNSYKTLERGRKQMGSLFDFQCKTLCQRRMSFRLRTYRLYKKSLAMNRQALPCSASRTRTYNPAVNSRMLYH